MEHEQNHQVVNGVTTDKSTTVANDRHASDEGTEDQPTQRTDVARARWTILRQVREMIHTVNMTAYNRK